MVLRPLKRNGRLARRRERPRAARGERNHDQVKPRKCLWMRASGVSRGAVGSEGDFTEEWGVRVDMVGHTGTHACAGIRFARVRGRCKWMTE